MANVALFRSGETPRYLESVHTPDWESDPDAIVNPDISAVDGVPLKYWKRVGDAVEAMTQGERDAVDAAHAAALLASNRATADSVADAMDALGIEWRAVVLLLIGELNSIRSWTRDLKAAIAAASNLAEVKTLVAATPTLPDRTVQQARTAYQNFINAGDAD